MNQHWQALQATLGLNINDWMGSVGRFVSQTDKLEANWKTAMKAMQHDTDTTLGTLDQMWASMGMGQDKIKDLDKAFAAFSDDQEKQHRDSLDRIATSKRAEEDAHAEQLRIWNEQAAADDRAAEASENAKLDRAVAADKARFAEEDLTEATRRQAMAAKQAAMADQARINSANQLEMELEALEIELATVNARFNETHSIGKKNSMMVFEFGRAIEDAAVGFSFNGIRGMVMGASNNLARMAEMAGKAGSSLAALGPYAAVLVSLSMAAYTLWQTFTDVNDETEEATDKLDKYIEGLEKAIELLHRQYDITLALRKAQTADDVQEMIDDRVESLDKELLSQEELHNREVALLRQREALVRSIQAAEDAQIGPGLSKTPFAVFSSEATAENMLRDELKLLDEQIAAVRDKWTEVKQEQATLNSEITEAEAELAAAALRGFEAELDAMMVERERLDMDRERLEIANQLAIAEERRSAAADIESILDPTASGRGRLEDDWIARQQAIDADTSLTDSERGRLTADNEAAFDEALRQLFDVDRLDELTEEIRQNRGENPLSLNAMDELLDQVDSLEAQFESGTITIEEFEQGLADIEQGMDQAARAAREAAEAAEEEAEAQRRAALLRGDFEGAGLSMEEALEDRLASERMREWNQLVDQQFDALMGTNEEMERWQKQMEKMAREEQKRYEQEHKFQGDEGKAIGALMSFMNSIEGEIATQENNLAVLQQTLDVFGDTIDALRKKELEDSIDNLTDILNKLYEQQRDRFSFTEVSGPAWFEDPGLQSPGNRSDTGGRRSGVTIINEFENIDRLTNSAVSEVSDRMAEESRRRGLRAF